VPFSQQLLFLDTEIVKELHQKKELK